MYSGIIIGFNTWIRGTAKYHLAKRYRIKTFKKDLIFPCFLVALGFGLILLQPDFGSGIVMVCSIVVMVLAADSPLSYFVRVGILGIAGFQIIQSLFAISPGGILGGWF